MNGMVLSRPFRRRYVFILYKDFTYRVFGFLLYVGFFRGVTSQRAVFVIVFFPTPSNCIRQILGEGGHLCFHQNGCVFGLRVVIRFQGSLWLMGAASVLYVRRVHVGLRALIRPFRGRPLYVLFCRGRPFHSNVIDMRFASLPRASRPNIFYLTGDSALN